MHRPAEFEQAVRRGARGGKDSVVVHLVTRTDPGPGPVVGFVVSKAVGNAVTRNLVKRRLRALVSERLVTLPSEDALVIRALPPAATRDYGSLGADLTAAIEAAERRRRRAARTVPETARTSRTGALLSQPSQRRAVPHGSAQQSSGVIP